MYKVSYDRLIEITSQILEGFGYPADRAAITAETLVEADARGVPSHGVARLEFYKSNIDLGFAVPDADPEVLFETPLSLTVDGHKGVGPYVSLFCLRRCMEKVKRSGAAFAAVRKSNHFGMAGLWAERFAKEGFIGIALTNTIRAGIPTFGRERMLGTNPICVAIPGDGDDMFMVDIATSTVSRGKIEVYDRRGKKMPEGWGVGSDGHITTDPSEIVKLMRPGNPFGGLLYLGGEGEILGGHKGYSLALLVELLCVGLSLGDLSRDALTVKDATVCHFFGAIDLKLFGDVAAIKNKVSEILEAMRKSAKAEGQERIYIPGEKETENRAKSLREGIQLDDATLNLLNKYAAELGVEPLA